MEQILLPNEGDRSYFDGTQFDGSQVHLDLNELVFALSRPFMALSSTPPSAHMSGLSWEMLFMETAAVPTPHVSPVPAEHRDEPPARGRDHRIPRCRGYGTGGHI
ncbi:hypothetical protein PIB30_003676 [Stylosanthes scabra]|uniref:Uncharacterized protein n=1 Tax=Stylosanthes scabra TaxID=79078 RepID=A0ABU6Z187_9FABA|nr:hypothetical protein [Stylosanthes scabra]